MRYGSGVPRFLVFEAALLENSQTGLAGNGGGGPAVAPAAQRQRGGTMRHLTTPIAISTALLIVACGGGPTATSETTPVAEAPSNAAAESSAGELAVPGARFDRPAGWTFGEPSSSMRLAEASIPGADGPALLTVFFFGEGGGGGTEANLQRWAGQIVADDETEPTRGAFKVNGYSVSTIAVEGTLQPSRMGGGPTEPAPGSKLIGAVVEGPGGPWFFKITGPAATVASAEPVFDAMLRSVRP
jgi:hypothetical protein